MQLDSVNLPTADDFATNAAVGFESDDAEHQLDFSNYVYYIILSLTLPEIATARPPAVAAIGAVMNPIGNFP
jgi:hypothetical protein